MKKQTKVWIIVIGVLCVLVLLDGLLSSGGTESTEDDNEMVETMDDDSSSNKTSNDVEFISASDFRNFIGDKSNIGKTVKFQAEVSMIFDNEYLLYVWCNNKMYEIRSNVKTSDPSLFDGDKVIFTGRYNGNTEGGNQLSFTTVSIELQ
ncbi:MAG: hypothetical protein IJA10_08465 [Lachnospiraceae bacterium]|nr:hypothetical protein [Lachnospiraceae bacterium]